jgi:hypothetical protein
LIALLGKLNLASSDVKSILNLAALSPSSSAQILSPTQCEIRLKFGGFNAFKFLVQILQLEFLLSNFLQISRPDFPPKRSRLNLEVNFHSNLTQI